MPTTDLPNIFCTCIINKLVAKSEVTCFSAEPEVVLAARALNSPVHSSTAICAFNCTSGDKVIFLIFLNIRVLSASEESLR